MVSRTGSALVEAPVAMREREHGTSSINALRSVYYVVKVTLALVDGDGRGPPGGGDRSTPVR